MRIAKVGERLVTTAALMLLVSVSVFAAMRLLPGDPVDVILSQGGRATAEGAAALRASFGLDRPFHVQLWLFLSGLCRGDLGYSLVYSQPVSTLIVRHIPATVELTIASVVVALAVSLPLGIVSAVKANSVIDRASTAGSLLGISMPGFWLGIVLIMVFSVELRWLPVSGRTAAGTPATGPSGLLTLDALWNRDFSTLGTALRHLVLPAVTMSSVMVAVLTRVLRASMLEELQKDYVAMARAKGAPESRVVVVHALRNALIPAVTVFGLQVGTMLSGNMIVETVFGWPGIGRLAVDAIFARDYALVQGLVIVFAVAFALANLAVDAAYTFLNPRVGL